MQYTTIVLADDHQIVLDGLREILASEPEFRVVGQATNGRALLTQLHEKRPDLVLLDLNMPGTDGLEVIGEIKVRHPSVKILVLTMYDSPEIVQRAMMQGADGYLLKDHGREELQLAVREVLSGRQFISEQAKRPPGGTTGTPFHDDFQAKCALTTREMEILRLIAHSYTNREIGDKLYISAFTVATHRRNLKRKLHAEHTADLIRFAYDNGLL